MSNWYYDFIDIIRFKVMLCPYTLQLMKINITETKYVILTLLLVS